MARNPDILTAADIDAFSRKLKATVARAEESTKLHAILEQFSTSLRSGGRGAAVPAAARTAAPVAGKRRRRARQPPIPPEKVLATLTGAKDGLSVGMITAKLGEKDKSRVAVALRTLRDDKKIKLKGEKRLARWYAA